MPRSFIVTIEDDYLVAEARLRALRGRMNDSQMVTEALRHWLEWDKPMKNPRPYPITILKDAPNE